MTLHGRKISVIGLGYVGLPVAAAFAKAGNQVIAFDINEERISELKSGIDRTNEVAAEDLARDTLFFTRTVEDLSKADFHIVAVPTPVDSSKKPDLSALISASKSIASALKAGDIVVYESTVYPGVTEEICGPILSEVAGLKAGKEFHLGYSPERINPGDQAHRFETITKVVAGETPEITEIIAGVYASAIPAGVHKASSIKVAEAAKVIENTQRDLNIALMNELAIIFERLDIDTGDVLAAAATKWNFLNFKPGLVGGHCIGVDPYYLTHRAEQTGMTPQVILAGRRINDHMGHWVAAETVKRILRMGLKEPGIVTVLGATFKENVPDVRNSKVVDIVDELKDFGVHVQVHDPLANAADVKQDLGICLCDEKDLKPAHAVVLAVTHDYYFEKGWPYIESLLHQNRGLVVDIQGKLSRDHVPDYIDLWRL